MNKKSKNKYNSSECFWLQQNQKEKLMKICPNCQQTYEDDGLNFCLNDGGVLQKKDDDAPPPTVMMPQARQTNPNVADNFAQPASGWQSEPFQPAQPASPWQSAPMQPSNQPFQPAVQTPNYMSPAFVGSVDQNLPIAAIICGSVAILFSFCCAGLFTFPLGIAAIITGFMGMNNANQNPQRYGGKNLAIGGMVTGAIGMLISLGLILISIAL
jgi:hypothetical protein